MIPYLYLHLHVDFLKETFITLNNTTMFITVIKAYFIKEEVMRLARAIEALVIYNQEQDVRINALFHKFRLIVGLINDNIHPCQDLSQDNFEIFFKRKDATKTIKVSSNEFVITNPLKDLILGIIKETLNSRFYHSLTYA